MALLIGDFKLIFFYILVILVYFPIQNHLQLNRVEISPLKIAQKSLKTIYKRLPIANRHEHNFRRF